MKRLLFFVLTSGLIFILSGISLPPAQPNQQDTQLRNLSGHLSVINFHAPNTLDFCGEGVPIDNPAIKRKVDREIERNTGYYASTLIALKRANRYRAEFSDILRAQGIPEDFFYLAMAESFLSNAISPKGAKGFWQFIAPTGRHYGLEISETVDERFHPVKATYAATRYLYDDFSQLKQWTLVAAAYNMGAPRVQRAIKRQGVDNYYELSLNAETSNYLYRIPGTQIHPGTTRALRLQSSIRPIVPTHSISRN